MDQTTSISSFLAIVDQQIQEAKVSIGQMLDQRHAAGFSASVARVNRMLDEITLQTDLLALSNVLQFAAPVPIKSLSPTA